jgi:hypothetical protein
MAYLYGEATLHQVQRLQGCVTGQKTENFKTANGVYSPYTNFTRGESFIFEMSYGWRCTRKCNFLYTRTKSAAFPLPLIFTKSTKAQQHYLLISCTEFQLNTC